MNSVEELGERIKELKGLLAALDSKLVLEEISEEKYTELHQKYESELRDAAAELSGVHAEFQMKKIVFIAGLTLVFLGFAAYIYSYTGIMQIEAHAVRVSGVAGEEAEGYVFLKTVNIISLLAAATGIVLTTVEMLKYETKKIEYKRRWVVERNPDEVRELLIIALRRKGAKVSESLHEIKASLRQGGGFFRGRIRITIFLSGTAEKTEIRAILTVPGSAQERWSSIRAHLDDLQL
jgi:hypothetical protein